MVKFYSDVTKKYYENETAAREAEEKLLKTQNEKNARRKEMAEEVEAKRKAYMDARTEYRTALDKFCKEYGSYHYTINGQELTDIFCNFFDL